MDSRLLEGLVSITNKPMILKRGVLLYNSFQIVWETGVNDEGYDSSSFRIRRNFDHF
jgi:hypothetical protein